jgi:hypothetical protein
VMAVLLSLPAIALNTKANTAIIAKFWYKRLASKFYLTLEHPDRNIDTPTTGETL